MFLAKVAKGVLANLAKCVKWHKDDKSVKVGDLVLLQEDNVKHGSWPLERTSSPWARWYCMCC